jgi:pSer/pThr/pTyr-binding forkhead associated (FHA) protein
MAIQLTITENGDPHSKYLRRFLQDRIVIGRARSSDVCLPDMAVSTRHAEIRVSGNDYVAVDLDSLNGTQVGGKALTAFRPRTLKNGDCLTIANFTIEFQLGVGSGKEEPRDTALSHARDMMANMLARAGAPREARNLVVVSGPHRASRFELPAKGTLVIGRGLEASIVLDDRDVWKKHAEVTITADGVKIRDLCGGQGLRVNGEPVDATALKAGDRFTVGGTTLALEHPAERSLGVIFEAPEEDTSSYSLGTGMALAEARPVTQAPEPSKSEPVEPAPESKKTEPETTSPPIGPADPLIPETPEPGTGAQPVRDSRDKTDFGLILVGAIIVLAAVAALVYLYS